MTKTDLKKMYDGKGINEIETVIQKNRGISVEADKQFIFALSYLRNGRFKENPMYAQSSFESYLKGQWNMLIGTFYEKERAYLHFPDEAAKYGVGLIAKVYRRCRPVKEKVVFAEIAKAQAGLKTPIKRDRIEAIIQKYSKPQKEKAPAIGWQGKYEREVKAHEETRKILSQAQNQIERLKATVLELRPLRDMKEALKPYMVETRIQ